MTAVALTCVLVLGAFTGGGYIWYCVGGVKDLERQVADRDAAIDELRRQLQQAKSEVAWRSEAARLMESHAGTPYIQVSGGTRKDAA
jgi:hypothetical protein